jgi:hypothetical protein
MRGLSNAERFLSVAKSDHIYSGDPRHHGDDIVKLQTRIRQLEQENKDLQEALTAATHNAWRSKGW